MYVCVYIYTCKPWDLCRQLQTWEFNRIWVDWQHISCKPIGQSGGPGRTLFRDIYIYIHIYICIYDGPSKCQANIAVEVCSIFTDFRCIQKLIDAFCVHLSSDPAGSSHLLDFYQHLCHFRLFVLAYVLRPRWIGSLDQGNLSELSDSEDDRTFCIMTRWLRRYRRLFENSCACKSPRPFKAAWCVTRSRSWTWWTR